MVQKEFNVQLQVKQLIPKNIGSIVQGDINGNIFIVSLIDGVSPIDITGYTTITFTVEKPDGTPYVDSLGDRIVVLNAKRGEISIIPNYQAIAAAGLCKATIEVWQGSYRITSAKMVYLVLPALAYGSNPASEASYPTLLALNAQLSSAEQTRVTQENGRVVAETGRVNEENLRKTQETARQQSINDIITSWNNLTTQQMQDAEVIVSRTSGVKAKTFASLDARIEEAEQDHKTHLAETAAKFSDVNSNIGALQLNKVDKVEGKGLSANDYTSVEKTEVAKVAGKADKTYVDTQFAAVGNGSPKGVYATLAALQTAYPTGTTGIYVVTADGKWYFWNGSAWTAGGTYQSTGIANNTIVEAMLESAFKTALYARDLYYQKVLVQTDNISGTTALAHGTYLIGSGSALPQGTFPTDYNTAQTGIFISIKASDYYVQILTQDSSTNKFWIRTHNNTIAPRAWRRIDNDTFFKKVLTSGDNVNELLTEGDYIVNSTVSPGTYPTGMGTYGTLTVRGSGNFWSQTLVENRSISLRTRVWARVYGNPGWSAWVETTNPETPEPVNPSQPLYGKKIVFFGDSITAGGGGVNNYPQYVGVRTGATSINLGVGGTQMAKHVAAPDYDPFSFYALADAFATNTWTNQDAKAAAIGKTDVLAQMKATNLAQVDYLFVAYGQNDRSNGVSVGTIASTNTAEFYGALKHGIETLWTAYPNLQIILCTPYNRPSVDGQIGPYADAIIDVCKSKYYIPVLDLFRTAGINTYTVSTYLDDGLHPNAKGHQYLGNKIGGWLLSVI